ncbi:MAG: tetratricopeptide repeat protein [Candidatus Nealsonbacteria bacterium]|nr:tetratricopeptide repeat protein [Candidatus Nealsonbacteria bacterium]
MSTHGLRLLVSLVGVSGLAGLLGLAGGCASVPPLPEHARNRPPGGVPVSGRGPDDEYEGWLFRSLTGGSTRRAPQQPTPHGAAASTVERLPPTGALPAPSVVPVSYEEYAQPNLTGQPDPDDSGFDVSDLAPDKILTNMKNAAGYGPDEAKARVAIQQGKLLFEQKRFADAAKQFSTAAARSPDSIVEEDALFYLGECQFFSDQYPKAQDTYGELLKDHGNTRHLDTVSKRLFSIAQYWEQVDKKDHHWPITPNLTDGKRPLLDTPGRAIKAYETIGMYDPTGPLADDAVMAKAVAFFNAGRWEQAAFQFDVLRKQYPKSPHQAKAHHRALQARMNVYQGPAYDNTPLLKADEIAQQALIQFPVELADQRTEVLRQRDRIAEQRAARDWLMAEFYDKKSDYGAARYYYRAIIKDYPPMSSYVRRAQQRLDEIRGKPDNPPKQFQWLTDLFPSEDE